jgi:hypothetical protein
MTKDLKAFSGGSLSKEILAKLQQTAASERDRIGSAGSGDVISINNGKRLFSLPGDQEVAELEAHIVDFAYRNEYYLGPYNAKDIQPPACFAIAPSEAMLSPSDNSPVKQNEDTCATCQQNQFGTHATGKGKACKNTVILALLPPNEAEEHDIWVLKTSPTAVPYFNKYASKVNQMNIPLSVVKTRIFLDPDSTYASVRFEPLGVDEKNIDILIDRKDEAAARLRQEPDVSQFEMPKASR